VVSAGPLAAIHIAGVIGGFAGPGPPFLVAGFGPPSRQSDDAVGETPSSGALHAIKHLALQVASLKSQNKTLREKIEHLPESDTICVPDEVQKLLSHPGIPDALTPSSAGPSLITHLL
jgi:hypothetical protein